jgi:hypothetical protein
MSTLKSRIPQHAKATRANTIMSRCSKSGHSTNLDLGNRLDLAKVVSRAVAEIVRVVVHRVYNRARAFKDLRGGEALHVEGLVVRAAGSGVSDPQLGAVDARDVRDELCDLRRTNATARQQLLAVKYHGLT